MSLLRRFARTLSVETLEARDVPAVSLLGIDNSEFPNNKPLFVPVTVNAADGTPTYNVTSNSANVKAEVVTGGRSLKLDVTGTDALNAPFSGTLVIRLFESAAPLATGNIVTLANAGYYNGKLFHRVINDFVAQGGSPTGDGTGGSSLITDAPDEFNTEFTFASRGIMAIANAGDDQNNAQFFITDPFSLINSVEQPAPLDRRPQHLNFNHTILGILTSGFDTYQRIMNVPKTLGNDGATSKPVNPVTIQSATVLTTNSDAVLKISAVGGALATAKIDVVATEGGVSDSKSFNVTSVADTVNDRPFLNALTNPTTSKNTPVTFTLSATELDATDVDTFTVGRIVNTANGPVFTTLDPTLGTATVTAEGKVTITPANGFTGNIIFTVGVRDQSDRVGSSLGLNDARNFDTQVLTLTVGPTTTTTISSTTTSPTNASTIPITVTFGESVTGFILSDIIVTNGVLTNFTSFSGSVYTATLTPSTAGTVTINIPSAVATTTFAGNPSAAATPFTIEYDLTGPTATLTTPTGNAPFYSNTFEVNVAFSEAVTGFDLADLVITNGVASGLSGSGKNYSFAISAPADGVVTINLPAGKYTDVAGNANTAASNFTLTVLPSTAAGRAKQFTIGADSGGSGTIALYDQNGALVQSITPFGTTFSGGLRTVAADVTGDDIADIILGTGPSTSGNSTVQVYDGADGKLLFTLVPFGTFNRGVLVSAGDITGDGRAEIAITAESGGGARVRVFSPDAFNGFNQIADFIALIGGDDKADTDFRGGGRSAIGDFNADGFADLAFAAGTGGGPRIAMFNGKTLATTVTKLRGDFFAFEPELRNGSYIAAGDFNADGQADLAAGAGLGGGPRVTLFDGAALVTNQQLKLKDVFVGNVNSRGGVRVAVKNLTNDAASDLIVGDGPGGSTALAFDGQALLNAPPGSTPTPTLTLTPFTGFTGGVYVG